MKWLKVVLKLLRWFKTWVFFFPVTLKTYIHEHILLHFDIPVVVAAYQTDNDRDKGLFVV